MTQKKDAIEGKKIAEEVVITIYKLLEYKSITTAQKKTWNFSNSEKIFKLSETYDVDGSILKCKYIRCSVASINQTIIGNITVFIDIVRIYSVNSLTNCPSELTFDVVQERIEGVYAVGSDIPLVSFGPIFSFT